MCCIAVYADLLCYSIADEGDENPGDAHCPIHWCAYKDAKDNPAALKAVLDWLSAQDSQFDIEVETGAGW